MPRREDVIAKIKRQYKANETIVAIVISAETIIEQALKENVILHPDEIDELLETLNLQQDGYNAIISRQIQLYLQKRKERMFEETQTSIPTGEQ